MVQISTTPRCARRSQTPVIRSWESIAPTNRWMSSAGGFPRRHTRMAERADADAPLRRNVGLATMALLSSSGTLVCCVLPALMVALGAGAALAGLVTAVPQLVWLSAHKALVFGVAFAMLMLSGAMVGRARTLPCPADPALALACMRVRRAGPVLWSVATACTTLGAVFAFVLPALQ